MFAMPQVTGVLRVSANGTKKLAAAVSRYAPPNWAGFVGPSAVGSIHAYTLNPTAVLTPTSAHRASPSEARSACSPALSLAVSAATMGGGGGADCCAAGGAAGG